MNTLESAPATDKRAAHEFLASTEFEPYQSVPLPYGLRTPGRDCEPMVDYILSDRIQDKSLLDVGTYYGLFPYEAVRRGAREAVGVERNAKRYQIARRIADFHGNAYRIVQGDVDGLDLGEKFDVVLFLNVLHHVLDPVAAIRNVAKHCSDTMIVEFCLTSDPALRRHFHGGTRHPGSVRRLHAYLRYWTFRAAAAGWPLITVGNRTYSSTYYLSREAFYNIFVVHHRLFSHVDFLPSMRQHRTIALCKVWR